MPTEMLLFSWQYKSDTRNVLELSDYAEKRYLTTSWNPGVSGVQIWGQNVML
jgi:hypothetical protein